jgi:hypothetical protein
MTKRNGIALRTDLSVEECLRRLREASDLGERTMFSFSGYKGSKRVLSKFKGNEFKLWKRRYYRNSFAPFFFGTLSPEERGTHLEGRFGMDPLAKIFVFAWVSLLVLGSLREWREALAGQWHDALVIIGMMLFGVLLPQTGKLIGRGEEKYLRQFVETTLAARTDDSGLVLSPRTIENTPL